MDILQSPWPNPTLPQLPFEAEPLTLRSTSGEFSITSDSSVRMYVCGITPYDATHLGHAATYLTFDLINRYSHLLGNEVNFVENITDIDEPLLERAARDGTDWVTLAQKETDLFARDMEALRVLSPNWFVPATQTMDLVDQAISAMTANGYTYTVENDIYFKTSSFLNELPISVEEAVVIFRERGGDPDRVGKEHPLDSVLWLANKNGEPGWDSSHGFGRPGWHIECAVISLRFLLGADFLDGDSSRNALIDIQGGGSDLIFPHHFMSAIQVKAITGQQFSRGYVHTGMVGLDGEKMSKSKGNLVFVSKLLSEGVDPVVIRLALLQSHYSSDRMWDSKVLQMATEQVSKIRAALARTEVAPTSELCQKITEAIADNLDTPLALRLIAEWASDTENGATGGSSGELSRLLDSVLGLAF
jgi:L-cysteine:1D-myo-inositol 2-amino-2-deoxy-alpha-D-glucopyranoside ligase